MTCATGWSEEFQVASPGDQINVEIDVREGRIFYTLSKASKVIVETSKIEIVPDAEMVVVDHLTAEVDTTWQPTWGQFNTIADRHHEIVLSLTADGMPVKLHCRVFDSGVGFRFAMGQKFKDKPVNFFSEFKLLDGQTFYHGQKGTSFGVEDLTKNPKKNVSMPLVAVRSDGWHVALLESDLYSATGFAAMKIRFKKGASAWVTASRAVASGAGQVSPWRVILVGETAGDLFVDSTALNLAAPCKLADTSWIASGRGLWDWRIRGYDNGDFAYAADTRSFLRLIDACADQGLEFLTVDDFWFTSAADGKMVVAADVDMKRVMGYAKEKGVKIILYYDRRKGDFGDETLFSYYAELGAAGIKYGFMGNDADFTRRAIDAAAANKLLINFHDGPVPMTGVERTMPNMITREYCHGQQDSRKAFTPETFLKMAMVSNLTGPLDMSNGNFGVNSINAGQRKYGPRRRNSYIATVVSEVARCLVIHTGLVTLPDAPEEYSKKADLFEFLKAMPATWDDSLVLNSKIGAFITVARRSGDVWFVASVCDQQRRCLQVPLNFLDGEKSYEATIYQDTADADGLTNPEAYEIKKITVQPGDVLDANMAVGGGHAIILRPAE